MMSHDHPHFADPTWPPAYDSGPEPEPDEEFLGRPLSTEPLPECTCPTIRTVLDVDPGCPRHGWMPLEEK